LQAGKLEYRYRRAEANEEFRRRRALEFLQKRVVAG
jgi:hypothetical protein